MDKMASSLDGIGHAVTKMEPEAPRVKRGAEAESRVRETNKYTYRRDQVKDGQGSGPAESNQTGSDVRSDTEALKRASNSTGSCFFKHCVRARFKS